MFVPRMFGQHIMSYLVCGLCNFRPLHKFDSLVQNSFRQLLLKQTMEKYFASYHFKFVKYKCNFILICVISLYNENFCVAVIGFIL